MKPFALQKDNIYAIPALHYSMECAAQVFLAIEQIQPDGIAVELPEPMQGLIQHATSRLPDLSVIKIEGEAPEYLMIEPADPLCEAIRRGQERGAATYCIDLCIARYPEMHDPIPDPYAIQRIGMEKFYTLCKGIHAPITPEDEKRELFMARKLKELSLRHDKVLFVGGMLHIERIFAHLDKGKFEDFEHAESAAFVYALSEDSRREVMGESGYNSTHYELERGRHLEDIPGRFPPDRQKLLYELYKEAGQKYQERSHFPFEGYHLRNLMKFVRNYSMIHGQLMPDLFKTVTAAKGCVDHNYAYEVWELATNYPFDQNIDNLEPINVSAEEVWGDSSRIRFHRKEKSEKSRLFQQRRRKDSRHYKFEPNALYGICSHPPEDVVIESFGSFLQKKGQHLFTEEGAQTIPFATSLEDGIDTRETIRHWHEKKLYVKKRGRPSATPGSVVVIFDEDEKNQFPWTTTWLGEHDQESDMALYATPIGKNLVGPGISRCTYGGFMMSYPPRRMYDVWSDPEYKGYKRHEILLLAAIDYSTTPLIIYVATNPPAPFFKSYASRYTKKLVYLPIGQLSRVTLQKIRTFHVLDGHDKREIAGDYIY